MRCQGVLDLLARVSSSVRNEAWHEGGAMHQEEVAGDETSVSAWGR